MSSACTVGHIFTLVSKRVLKLVVGSPLKVHHIARVCAKISNEEAGSAGKGLLTLLRGTAHIRRCCRLANRPKKTITKPHANSAAQCWRHLSRRLALSLKQGCGTYSAATEEAPKPPLGGHDLPF